MSCRSRRVAAHPQKGSLHHTDPQQLDLRPARKVYYNAAITGLSVAVALVVGGIELTSVVTGSSASSEPLAAIATLDLGHVGFLMVGIFVAAWVVAIAVWKVGRIKQQWRAS